jgi:hypothetical protein
MKTRLETIMDCKGRLAQIEKDFDLLMDKHADGEEITFRILLTIMIDLRTHSGYINDFLRAELELLDPSTRNAEQKILDLEVPKRTIRLNAQCD